MSANAFAALKAENRKLRDRISELEWNLRMAKIEKANMEVTLQGFQIAVESFKETQQLEKELRAELFAALEARRDVP